MKKLFVGNLPFKVNNGELMEMFAKAGTVSEADVIMNRDTGQSKGFGFVTFENDAEADAAVEMWHGKEIEGRALTVNEARPMAERPRNNFRKAA